MIVVFSKRHLKWWLKSRKHDASNWSSCCISTNVIGGASVHWGSKTGSGFLYLGRQNFSGSVVAFNAHPLRCWGSKPGLKPRMVALGIAQFKVMNNVEGSIKLWWPEFCLTFQMQNYLWQYLPVFFIAKLSILCFKPDGDTYKLVKGGQKLSPLTS